MEEQTFIGGEEFAELRGQAMGWLTPEVIEVAENNRNKNRKNDNEPTARVLTMRRQITAMRGGRASLKERGGQTEATRRSKDRSQFWALGHMIGRRRPPL